MNELETATFASQHTTMQELIVWAPLIYAGAVVFAAIGIWVGVIAMTISNIRHSREIKEFRRADDLRHEKAMAAHKEVMAAREAAHKEAMMALQGSIRRTSSTGPATPTAAAK